MRSAAARFAMVVDRWTGAVEPRRLCRPRTTVAAVILAVLAAPANARGGLSDAFESPLFGRLGLAPLGPVLAASVASTYPIASASASVVYRYNPAIDSPERRPGLLGPILGERAETVGRGKLDLGLSYSFVDLTSIDGEPLDDLVNAPLVRGRLLFFPVPGGVKLADGRASSFLPVRVTVDIGVTAHIVTPTFTYGVTPDLDVNLTLPLLRTALDVEARTRVPDPRLPAFALSPGDPAAGTSMRAVSDESEGVGDVLLRGKYVLRRGGLVDIAAGLGLTLPSGRVEDFHGTGTTGVQPLLIGSRAFGNRVELLANAGADINTDDVDRSLLRWAAGGTVAVVEPLAAAVVFLGRHELGIQSERIRLPFFFQIERSDVVDAAVGLRWRFAEAGVFSANALVPINREGLRPDVIPTVQMEWAF
jgi:hypothetical protein